jgi:hypothetical protein
MVSTHRREMTEPDFYLGSQELTAWAVPRAVRLLEPAGGDGRVRAALDPPAPDGATELVLAPRYAGDSLADAEPPVHVNVFAPDGTLVAVGELYRTREEAAATTGGVGRA